MSEALNERIDEIFLAALEREPRERPAYLDEVCGDDKALRARIEDLLAAHAEAEDILPAPPQSTVVLPGPDPAHALEGQRIGRYLIRRLIATGGMGTVYEAEQEQPRRTVALKVLRVGLLSSSGQRRFEYESQILARLRHPNIAQVYEAGMHEADIGPIPYFAMEYIPNARTITQYANEERLFDPQRLELLAKVCDAVQHGHQNGVIHRDLTPSNILIDADGEPKIIDFGVARLTGVDADMTTQHTDLGQLIGTVTYMSPEQAGGESDELDTRSDVYALGVLGYELLSGQLPYDVRKKMIHEAVRVIREDDPTPMSAINRIFRGDVETIISKALEKEKVKRYQSASELAADIRRYLHDEPIIARPASAWYQLYKFARRNRALVGGVAASFVILIVGVIVTSLALWRALSAEDLAETRLEAATVAEAKATVEAERARFQSYVSAIAAARAALDTGDVATARDQLEQAPDAHRNFEWSHLRNSLDQSTRTLGEPLSGLPSRTLSTAAYSPDGSRVVCGNWRAVEIWDRQTGKQLKTLRGHESWVRSPAYSPDGSRIVSAGGPDGTVRVWNAQTGEQELLLRSEGAGLDVHAAMFSPDGRLIATSSNDFLVRLWDAEAGEKVGTLHGHGASVHAVAFSPGGSHLATASTDRTLRIWSVATRTTEAVLRGHTDEIQCVAWSPDGQTIISGGRDHTLRVWNAESGKERNVLRGHTHFITSIAISPDGRLIASGSVDRTLRLWDAKTGELLRTLHGHAGPVRGIAFNSDGQHLLSTDGFTLKEWDVAGAEQVTRLDGHFWIVRSLDFNRDGSLLASAGADSTARLWDVAAEEEHATLIGHTSRVYAVAFSPDGTRLATSSDDRSIRFWDPQTGAEIAKLTGHEGGVNSIDFRPDGLKLISGGDRTDKTIRIWNVSTAQPSSIIVGHEDGVLDVRWSPDGDHLASLSRDRTVRIWDAATGAQEHVLSFPFDRSHGLAFSPDSLHLAAVTAGTSVTVWEVQSGRQVASLHTGSNNFGGLTFSPDGTRLATWQGDERVLLWDTARWEQVATFRMDTGGFRGVVFSPDGSMLAAGSMPIHVWHREASAARNQAVREARTARRQAAPLVVPLLEGGLTVDQVVQRVETDESLDPAVKASALRIARTWSGRREVLGQRAWEIARQPEDDADQYRLARRIAHRLANYFGTEVPDYWTTFGMADYRLRRYGAALSNLRRAEMVRSASPVGRSPADLAFIAMSHHQLGHRDEAADAVAELRRLMEDPINADNEDYQAFVREAEALIELESAVSGTG